MTVTTQPGRVFGKRRVVSETRPPISPASGDKGKFPVAVAFLCCALLLANALVLMAFGPVGRSGEAGDWPALFGWLSPTWSCVLGLAVGGAGFYVVYLGRHVIRWRVVRLRLLFVMLSICIATGSVWLIQHVGVSPFVVWSVAGLLMIFCACGMVASGFEPLPSEPKARRAVIAGHLVHFGGMILVPLAGLGGIALGIVTNSWTVVAAIWVPSIGVGVWGYRKMAWVEDQLGYSEYRRHFPELSS